MSETMSAGEQEVEAFEKAWEAKMKAEREAKRAMEDAEYAEGLRDW